MTHYLSDYQPPAYKVSHVDLTFDLDKDTTHVKSIMTVERTKHANEQSTLRLDGDEKYLDFHSIRMNGMPVSADDIQYDEMGITLKNLPERCEITIENSIHPEKNESCLGIYRSNGHFTSQCESEAFRQITYFPDRPNNLAIFTTTIRSDVRETPVMLSNGNVTSDRTFGHTREVTYHDPYPKPSYLFALVAGKLSLNHETLEQDGRDIDLKIFADEQDIAKTAFAMRMLRDAMNWDREAYQLPYDLDVYNIVGMRDFNMGAMENKGLNLFNAADLLATPNISTDSNFERIATVISHEFNHNYAGNRVTVEHWAYLSLKEGLATRKEQEFLDTMIGFTNNRIENVDVVKSAQFPEDAGPNAHPVLNTEYESIENFYTATTYYKGAELLFMLSNMIGLDTFRVAMKNYFDEFDGQAVNLDQFLGSVERSTGEDLTQFKRWYTQVGTPQLSFTEQYDPMAQTYTISFKQTCRPDLDGNPQEPFHIPIEMGLVYADGTPASHDQICHMRESEQSFVFEGVTSKPIPSILRNFSAPVNLSYDVYSNASLIKLIENDTNEFNRYSACEALHKRMLMSVFNDCVDVDEYQAYQDAMSKVLNDESLDYRLRVNMLSLPDFKTMARMMETFEPRKLKEAYGKIQNDFTIQNNDKLAKLVSELDCPDDYTPENARMRSMKNFALGRLCRLDAGLSNGHWLGQSVERFYTASNMTDRLGALNAVMACSTISPACKVQTDALMQSFYGQFKDESLVVEKFFAMQAKRPTDDPRNTLNELCAHEAFDIKNPNLMRCVFRVFMSSNMSGFHHDSGEGYRAIAEKVVEIAKFNPSMAADLAKGMTTFTDVGAKRAGHLIGALEFVRDNTQATSVLENVNKSIDFMKEKYPHAQAPMSSRPQAFVVAFDAHKADEFPLSPSPKAQEAKDVLSGVKFG